MWDLATTRPACAAARPAIPPVSTSCRFQAGKLFPDTMLCGYGCPGLNVGEAEPRCRNTTDRHRVAEGCKRLGGHSAAAGSVGRSFGCARRSAACDALPTERSPRDDAPAGNVDVGLNGEVRTRRQKLVQCESDRSHLSLARVLTAIDRSGKVALSMDQRLWVAQQLAQALLDLAEPRRPAGRHSKASGGNGPPGRTFLATIAGTVTAVAFSR
jgi:hypothetical protein